MEEKIRNTHAFKAESYDTGRPHYPMAFFEYLYNEIGLNSNSIIADIGAGTGKITREFLKRGNKVFAVEPDKDMIRVLKNNLSQFTNCTTIESIAEDTNILDKSVDFIFCGNSYHWFNRNKVVHEFNRIIKNNNGRFNIIITTLGANHYDYSDEYHEVVCKYFRPVLGRKSNTDSPFINDSAEKKIFEFVVYQGYDEFINGALSGSFSPTPDDDCFEEYCKAMKQIFENYNKNGKLETPFILTCMFGRTKNLVM